MSHPLISVIIPIYNVEQYVSQCIDSIINQTYRNIQVILVDDGSCDASADICDRYALLDDRIYVIHKINEGVSVARNVGIDVSRGEFIIFIDADDWLDTSALKNLVTIIEEQSADVVTCDFNIVTESNSARYSRNIISGNSTEFLNSYLASGMSSSCGCLIRRSLCVDNGLYFPVGIKYCEDVHFMGRLLLFSKMSIHSKSAYYNYYQRSDSVIHSFNKDTMGDEIKVCFDLIQFYQAMGVSADYVRTMNWRLLKSTQELVLSPKEHSVFISLCSKMNNNDIWSCPLINIKIKIMSLLLLNKLGWIVTIINNIRFVLGR